MVLARLLLGATPLLGLVAIQPMLPAPEGAPAAATAAPLAQDQEKDPDAAATCAMCHKAFYDEWKDRAHNRAWLSPVYQAAIKEKSKPELCHACHIPDRVLDRLGKRPEVRKASHDEGITCVSCHKGSDDAIHGPFGSKTDAHPVTKDPAFSGEASVAMCNGCHSTKIGPVLPLGRDFEEAGFVKEGKTCNQCHMPAIERHLATSPVTGKPVGEKRKTRNHRILGPNDPEFCAKAFEFEAKATEKEIVVTITNTASHRVPGLTLRKFPVALVVKDRDGKEHGKEVVEFSSENELRAREVREVKFPRAAGADRVEVVVDHVFQDQRVATITKQTLPLE